MFHQSPCYFILIGKNTLVQLKYEEALVVHQTAFMDTWVSVLLQCNGCFSFFPLGIWLVDNSRCVG